MAASRRSFRSKAARLVSAAALLAAWSSLQAGDRPEHAAVEAPAPPRPPAPAAPALPAPAPAAPLSAASAGFLAAAFAETLAVDPLAADPRFALLQRQTAPPPPPAPVPEIGEPPLPALAQAPNVVEPPPPVPLPPPVRRRDPVEPPLVEDEAWQEWLLAVTLNGAAVSDGTVVLRGPDDAFALRLVDLRAWRVRIDEDRVITFAGEPFYPLDGFPDARHEFDAAGLALALELPAELFDPSRIAPRGFEVPPPVAGAGAFADYDVLLLAADRARSRVDGLVELGLFNEQGVLVGNMRLEDLTGDRRGVTRLETTLIKDMPGRRASLRLGDSLTASGALGRPVRFGGIQYATDFAIDPTFVTFPLPTIGGLAEQPSVVDVFVGNARRLSESVPPGPFEIDSLPVVTGAGELQLRVTDLLGRERLVTQSYYVSPRLLRPGLHDFSYEAGLLRERFGARSFDYGKPAAVGTHRYGFSGHLTGEAHGELRDDQQMAALGGSLLLPRVGLLSGGLGASHDRDAGEGWLASLDYEYRSTGFNLGLRSRYASQDFRQLGALRDQPAARRVDQLNLGLGFGPYGRLGLLLVHSDERAREDRLALSGSYGLSVGPGSLSVNALRTLEPSRDFALTATYSMPLAPQHSVSAQGTYRDRGSYSRLQYRKGRGSSDLGLSYRVAAQTGETPDRADASFTYDARLASARLDLSHRDGDNAMRANVSGSLAHVDGRTRLSRRLGRAFGLVALPGFPDVRVYLDNREAGRTDADGYLLLPSLRPYEANRVRIEPTDLPLTAEIDSVEATAVPFARSGMTVALPIRRLRNATATLHDGLGQPLPAGLELASADGRLGARLGRGGLAYVTGEGDGQVVVEGRREASSWRCTLLMPTGDEPMPDLGEIACDAQP